ncbi:MAG: hypothetical protein M3Z17_05880 [Gemmatimonadota bacterium]|nr:hypothetical protein [Gemmatimonadota bacterium]
MSLLRCARQVALARRDGAFGPVDSLGHAHHCLRGNGRWVGVFADIDTSFVAARNVVAVDLGSRARFTQPLDTGQLIALELAEWTAQRHGAAEYRSAQRMYTPVTLRFEADSIEAWLIPASLIMGETRTVGGERGYVFTPDGKQVVREMDSFADYRPIMLADTGQVRIVSSQETVPTISELVLANVMHDNGRSVAIVTHSLTSILVPSGDDVWIHLVNKR